MAPSNPISGRGSAALHELLDILSAIQHTIVDPLNDLTREEIERLGPDITSLYEILKYSVNIVAHINELNGGRGMKMWGAINNNIATGPDWGSVTSGTVIDAQFGNETLKHVPGISRSTIEGLLSTLVRGKAKSESGTEFIKKIFSHLQRFIEPLEAIVSTLKTADTRMIKSAVEILIDRILYDDITPIA